MSDIELTGSENLRFGEIHDNWLVFEGLSNSDFSLNNILYSLPLGQNINTDIIIDSGSFQTVSGAIEIEKDIYIFDNEIDAQDFVAEVGEENIVSYCERHRKGSSDFPRLSYEIQVINYPSIVFGFDLDNAENNNGFLVEVFASQSVEAGGVRKVTDEVILDKRGKIKTDTYLKFFNLKEDV